MPLNTPNGHVSLEGQTELDSNGNVPEAVIVDMSAVMNAALQQQQQQLQQQQQPITTTTITVTTTASPSTQQHSNGIYANPKHKI